MARSYPDFTCVCYDDIGAVTTLLKYLHQSKHHQKIGFIGIEQHDQTTGALRYQAYMDYCQQNQISPNAYLGNLSYRSGYELAQSILSLSPTAIVCATDAIALGLNKYLQQNQLEHIVVASIGNSELLNFLFPNTLTVELGFDKAGTYAAKELLSMLQNTTLAKTITVPSTLIFNE